MTRLLQLSIIIALLLVARWALYAWLRQPDALPRLLRRSLDLIVGYFAYITFGLLVLSLVVGEGFGPGREPQAVVIMLGAAVYTGVGILGLWLLLRDEERRTRRQ